MTNIKGASWAAEIEYKIGNPPKIIQVMEDSLTTVTNESEAIADTLKTLKEQRVSKKILAIFDLYEGFWFSGLSLSIPIIIRKSTGQSLDDMNIWLLIIGLGFIIAGTYFFLEKGISMQGQSALLAHLEARSDSLRNQINIIQARFHDQIQTTT